MSDYKTAVKKLCKIHGAGNEQGRYKALDVIDKFVDFVHLRGTKEQYVDALWLMLPESPIYSIVEGIVRHPADTYRTISQIIEAEEKKRINTLIGERRTRLGAKLSEVIKEVKREVYAKSKLEYVYRQFIDWTRDDELRHMYEDKLLLYCYDLLEAAPKELKPAEIKKVLSLAEGIVIIKRPFKLAWDITINWKDAKEIKGWDVDVLRDYCSIFPDSDLYKIITGFLTSNISPFPQKEPEENMARAESDSDSDDDVGGGVPTEVVPVTDEDRLLMMTDGINTADSLFAYRIMGEYYQHLQEYESNVELMHKALDLVQSESEKTGLCFQNTRDAVNLYLATALVFYQSPRHHSEAKAIFDGVLEHDATSTSAMIGIGLIYEQEEDYDDAVTFLERALARDASNLRVKSEAAWVKALKGDHSTAKLELEALIPLIRESSASKSVKDLLALTLYRLGVCIWNMDTSKAARRSRKAGAYPLFLEALKNDLGLAPAYTMLGIYFADYANDKMRSRRCFQQAVELSPSEVVAAERLARSFAEDGSWDHVELIAQRVVESGKVKPSPGSKRKGISWPFAALGVAQLNKGQFSEALMSFQASLRLSPDNYPAWVGLGESYASSGRYVAATKAILQARTLEEPQGLGLDDTWFTKYMLANIKREIADYDEAIMLYGEVLSSQPSEEGVAIALLQTLVESGYACLGKGLFGRSISLAVKAIGFATTVSYPVAITFNYWKAVGDACSLFSHVQSRLSEFPMDKVRSLIEKGGEAYAILSEVDGVDTTIVNAKGLFPDEERPGVSLTQCLHATMLAYKMAVHVSNEDIHAQSVAYYNLGWSEYRAHACLPRDLKKSSRYLKASARCFKRAIELEARNAEFWNALGVVTCQTHPAVSQHSFARSLYINGQSPVAWTNLGTLALLHKDIELAIGAFTRAQSIDPEYAHAWVGQGFVSLLRGDSKEARVHFTHAVGISDAWSIPCRKHYSWSTFDHILAAQDDLDITSLIMPAFALRQLKCLDPRNDTFVHLGSLFQERSAGCERAISELETLCQSLRTDYESTKSSNTLGRLILGTSDLSRMYLAEDSFEEAAKSAEATLKLVDTGGPGSLTHKEISRARLSCHLTIGLAYYHLKKLGDAVSVLETALSEAKKNPEAACLLTQVLWAAGAEDAREQAREVLFSAIYANQDHVPSVLLLGIIGLLDEDEEETREAVAEELLRLRTSDAADTPWLRHGVAEVLSALLASDSIGLDEEMAEAQTETMLYPHLPHGWDAIGALATATADDDQDGQEREEEARKASEMAMQMALSAVPPAGRLSAEELASAMAGMGVAADAQRAVMVAPWKVDGWQTLVDSVY